MNKIIKVVVIASIATAGIKAVLALCGGAICEVIAYALIMWIFWTVYRKVIREIGD